MPSTYNFTGGIISDNEAIAGGGGFIDTTDFFNGLSDHCQLTATCTGNGGCENCTQSLDDNCAIIFNNRATNGGGIYNRGVLDLDGIVVQNNSAESGGGIYATNNRPSLNILRALGIYQNEATENGGGIYLEPNAALQTTGAEFVNNTAGVDGGAIFAQHEDLTTDVTTYFCGNSASRAVAYVGSVPSQIQSCTQTVWENALNNYDISAIGADVPNPCEQPEFTLQKLAVPETPLPGSLVTYTVHLTNTGSTPAPSATFLDTLPGGMTLEGGATVTLPNGTTQALSNEGAPTQPLFNVNTIISLGDVLTLTYQARVPETAQPGIPLTNSVTINSETTPPAEATVTPGRPSFVSLTKLAEPLNPVPNAIVTYFLTDQNTGTAPAASYTIHDQLPTGLTLQGPLAATITYPDGTVSVVAPTANPDGSFTIPGPIPVGAYVFLSYNALVGPNVQSGVPLTNSATPSFTDENGNNYEEDPAHTTVTPEIPTLTDAQKTVSPILTEPNSVLTYSVSAINNSAQALTSYTITDTMPNQGDGSVTYIPGSIVATINGVEASATVGGTPTEPTFTVGPVPIGANIQFLYQGQVSNLSTDTNLINTATPSYVDGNGNSYEGAPVTATATVRTPNFPETIKTVQPDNPAPGSLLTYMISTTNNGDLPAASYTITDLLPNNGDGTVTYVPGSAVALLNNEPIPVTVSGTNTIPIFQVGTIPPGGQLTLLYQGRVSSSAALGQTLINVAAPSYTDNFGNTYMGPPATTLAIVHTPTFTQPEKNATPDNPRPGDQVTYTILATNTGPTVAKTFTITDQLPDQVSYVASSVTGQINGAATTVSTTGTASEPIFTVGPVPPGGTVRLTYTVQLSSDIHPGTILINTATPSYTDEEGNVYPGDPATAIVIVTSNGAVTEPTPPPLDPQYPETSKTVSPANPAPNSLLTYTVTATNSGNMDLSSYQISEVMPNQGDGSVTYVPDSAIAILDGHVVPLTVNDSPTHPTFAIGSFPIGTTLTIIYQGHVASNDALGQTLINEATPSFTDQAGNSYVSEPVTATAVVQIPSFSQPTKVVYPDNPEPGQVIMYTILATNTGNTTAEQFIIRDLMPNHGDQSVTYLPGTVSATIDGAPVPVTGSQDAALPEFTVGPVPPGGTVLLTYNAQVSSQATGGTVLTNSATPIYVDAAGNSHTGAPVTATAIVQETVIPPDAHLHLHKTADFTHVSPGGENIYHVSITSDQAVQAPIHLTDFLPDGLTLDGDYDAFVDGNPVRASLHLNGSTPVFTIDESLLPGQVLTLSYGVHVSNTAQDGEIFINHVQAHSPNAASSKVPGPPVVVTVPMLEDQLVVSKTASLKNVQPGSCFQYIIHVTNIGDKDALPTVRDLLPDGVMLDANFLCRLRIMIDGVDVSSNVQIDESNPAEPVFNFNDPLPAKGGTLTLILPVCLSCEAVPGTVLSNIAIAGTEEHSVASPPANITVLGHDYVAMGKAGLQKVGCKEELCLFIRQGEGASIRRSCHCNGFELEKNATYKVSYMATLSPGRKCSCLSLGTLLDDCLLEDSIVRVPCIQPRGQTISHNFTFSTNCQNQCFSLVNLTCCKVGVSHVYMKITRIQ